MNHIKELFSPFTSSKLSVENRIVMAPMSRGLSNDGVPGSDVVEYYTRRAQNHVGLIITEGTFINHADAYKTYNPKVPKFYGEDALAGWAKVVKAVHEVNGKIIPQLWHMGTGKDADEYTEKEIADIINAYKQAATDAKKLGFDGIELHFAHGYTVDSFFWDKTNHRSDLYGGSIENRTRFATEIVKACRTAVGEDFPILARISQWKTVDKSAKMLKTPEELKIFLNLLSHAGIDIFDCSGHKFWEPEFENSELTFAGWVKRLSGKPSIAVGCVGLNKPSDFENAFNETISSESSRMEQLCHMIEKEEIDLIAVGRSLLADSTWATKIYEGHLDALKSFNAIKSTSAIN